MLRTVDPAIPAGTMSSVPHPTIAVDDELMARPFHFGDVDRVIEAFADPDTSGIGTSDGSTRSPRHACGSGTAT